MCFPSLKPSKPSRPHASRSVPLGLLRRDIVKLRETPFDYAILDATGRFGWVTSCDDENNEPQWLQWDDGPAWRVGDCQRRARCAEAHVRISRRPDRNRKERVERFQNDADCQLFLISLKAGGQGLNLTAADYVFILDPWWNPAVEAQAVDRAHRIGQTKPVFAYRLIAKDTIEEKILQLQGEKRQLAEAIVSADENLLRTLTAEDLQMLLS
jgi:hypothetical protein